MPFNEVKVNDQYQLSVPEYLHTCTDLSEKASLQLQSIDQDVYLLAMDEGKPILHALRLDYTLKEYLNEVLKQPFLKNIKHQTLDTLAQAHKTTYGQEYYVANISGTAENEQRVFYKIGVFESRDYFYQVIIWTREGKRKTVEPDMVKILESFKELEVSEDVSEKNK